MNDALSLAPQLAVAIAVVGLVVWLQQSQRKALAADLGAMRRAFAAPPPVPVLAAPEHLEVRLVASLEALDRRMASLEAALGREVESRERVERDMAKLVVAVARLETNVRWLRGSLAGAGDSEAPES